MEKDETGIHNTKAGRIIIEELKAQIRQDAALRRACTEKIGFSPSVQQTGPHSVHWLIIKALIHKAAHHGLEGPKLPGFARFRGFTRRLARGAAKIVLLCGRIITQPQGEFNRAILEAFRTLARLVRNLDDASVQRDQQLARMEAELAELKTRIALGGGPAHAFPAEVRKAG